MEELPAALEYHFLHFLCDISWYTTAKDGPFYLRISGTVKVLR